MVYRALWSMILVCVFLPGVGHAQHRHIHGGYGYGPRVAPDWSYPGLYDGPFVAYAGRPPFVGFGYPPSYRPPGSDSPGYGPGYGSPGYGPDFRYGFGWPGFGRPGFGYPGFGWPGYFGYPGFGWPFFGYSGRAGSFWSNGLSLYGPPVPTYAPLPGVFGNDDLVRQWRSVVAPGFAGYNVIGIYSPYPRTRHPNVAVWPVIESITTAPVAPVEPTKQGGCLILSVKVPQPAAEVLVDGIKTVQTGTDRIFESPPLEAGRTYKYTLTARWVERGQVFEVTRIVTGTPGEVVRVDFTAPETGK